MPQAPYIEVASGTYYGSSTRISLSRQKRKGRYEAQQRYASTDFYRQTGSRPVLSSGYFRMPKNDQKRLNN